MRKLLTTVATLAGLIFIVLGIIVGLQSPERLPQFLQKRPSIYLKIAFRTIEQHAVSPKPIDWPIVFERATELAKDAKTPADTYPAIRKALEELGEGQALLIPPAPPAPETPPAEGAYGLQVPFPEKVVALVFPKSAAETAGLKPGDIVEAVNGQPPAPSSDPATLGRFVDLPKPSVNLRVKRGTQTLEVTLKTGPWVALPALTGHIGPDVGYLGLPAAASEGDFALRVRESIEKADDPKLCGWIVDLRRDNGGSLFPPVIAMRPILGEGPLGFIVRQKDARTVLTYPDDAPGTPPIPLKALATPNPKVAVLMSRLTANAGETIAVLFRGRPDTRFFGEPTWGAPTESFNVKLPDGAVLRLPIVMAADRAGKIYVGRLGPDQIVANVWEKMQTPEDAPVVAAAGWIREGCKKK